MLGVSPPLRKRSLPVRTPIFILRGGRTLAAIGRLMADIVVLFLSFVVKLPPARESTFAEPTAFLNPYTQLRHIGNNVGYEDVHAIVVSSALGVENPKQHKACTQHGARPHARFPSMIVILVGEGVSMACACPIQTRRRGYLPLLHG